MTMDSCAQWLGETPQLDLSDSKLRITAQKLTQAKQTHAARAAAIQDYVRRIPFAATVGGGAVRASEILRQSGGDCHSKGVFLRHFAGPLGSRPGFCSLRDVRGF